MSKVLWTSEIGVFSVAVTELPAAKPATRYAELGVQGRMFVVLDKPEQLRELAGALEAAADALEGIQRIAGEAVGPCSCARPGPELENVCVAVHLYRGPGVWCEASGRAVANTRDPALATCATCLELAGR